MLTTLFGITIQVNKQQSQNAPPPILVTLFGKIILDKDPQS